MVNDLKQLKDEGNRLLDKFNRPQDFDKLTQAQANVDDLKRGVQENVNKLITNQDELNDLEHQTNEMRDTAGKFEKNAKSLEREMCMRKVKYTIIIVGIVIAIVLIIVLSVVLSRK